MQCLVIILLSALFVCNASRCFTVCRCSKEGQVVICAAGRLTSLPSFPADVAEKITVLGLQRNQLSQVDGAELSRRFPALTLIDLRDQTGQHCVALSSPFLPDTKVLGEFLFVCFLIVLFYTAFYTSWNKRHLFLKKIPEKKVTIYYYFF